MIDCKGKHSFMFPMSDGVKVKCERCGKVFKVVELSVDSDNKLRIANPKKSMKLDYAKTIWAMYMQYGFGHFDNWLTMRKDYLDRSKVIEALSFPETRKLALNAIKNYNEKIDEIELLLEESIED